MAAVATAPRYPHFNFLLVLLLHHHRHGPGNYSPTPTISSTQQNHDRSGACSSDLASQRTRVSGTTLVTLILAWRGEIQHEARLLNLSALEVDRNSSSTRHKTCQYKTNNTLQCTTRTYNQRTPLYADKILTGETSIAAACDTQPTVVQRKLTQLGKQLVRARQQSLSRPASPGT